MPSLREHFEEFFRKIEPDSDRKAYASATETDLRDYLEDSEEFPTSEPHTRLIGSYARNTAVGDIKDVDLLVFGPDEMADGTPASALKSLRNALAEFPGASSIDLRPQRRSVRIELNGFMLDVVPACALNGIDKALVVPDREQSEWLDSHPLGYGALVSDINGGMQKKPVPLVKALKQWRDHQMRRQPPKSYLLETLVLAQVRELDLTDKGVGESLREVFEAIYDRCSYALENGSVPKIADLMLGNNLAKEWEPEAFQAFMRRVDESRKWVARAVDAEHEAAVDLWRRVLGDAFPEFDEKCPYCAGNRLAEVEAAAGLFVTTGERPRLVPDRQTKEDVKVPDGRYWSDSTF